MEEFIKAKQSIFFRYQNIIIKQYGSYEYEWFYESDSSKTYTVSDIFLYKDYIYQIKASSNGSEKYRLECLHKWYIDNVGTNIIVNNHICYVLTAKNKLWYNSLIGIDYKSGKVIKTIYEEKDKRFNLNLIRGDNNCIFLIRDNSGKQNLFVIEDLEIAYENIVLQSYFPIGYYKGIICYFFNINNIWYPKGFKFSYEKFHNEIEYASLKNNILILRDNGLKRVFDFKKKEIYSFYGNLILNKFVDNPFDRFFIDFTDSGIQEYHDFVNKTCYQRYCKVKRYFVGDIQIPLIVAKPLCKITGLMVTAYGGYGLPTSLSSTRWKPYLDDGWIIAYACVRGSGDVDKVWADSARTYNKGLACEDLELCIQYLQNKYNISSNHTCIYGRSAGGYLVGATIARNPDGKLFKMAYTEVPYVDVLRTTTNPILPLTILEYDEFGNPADGIQEFRTIMDLSPVNIKTSPDICVLIRTSENDSEVFPYESYKWLEALRGNKKNHTTKLLYNTQKKGHFVMDYENFSEDFFLLKSFRDVK
jgi:protease II